MGNPDRGMNLKYSTLSKKYGLIQQRNAWGIMSRGE
jgi:hypothetical protein